MRIVLLTVFLALPAMAQVWQPDGTQIRLRRPTYVPRFLDQTLAPLLAGPRVTSSSAFFVYPSGALPALLGWSGREPLLERVAPDGRITPLPSPEALELYAGCPIPIQYWNGVAYALGYRRHPATSRVMQSFQKERDLPLEVWVSRDFSSWQPLAWYAPINRPGHPPLLYGILPLENGQFLGITPIHPEGSLVILDRRSSGELEVNRWLDWDPTFPWICRSRKGVVLVSQRGHTAGDYRLLDNRDGRELARGSVGPLKRDRTRLVTALARPDGNVLLLMGLGDTGNPNLELGDRIYDPNAQSPSTRMALGLLNAKNRREHPSLMIDLQLNWFLLDPNTGQQEPMTSPNGFPKKWSSTLQIIQFRDPQNLDW